MAEVTEQIVREAPEIEAYKVGLLKSAKELTEKDLNLPAVQAAGLSDAQTKAINLGLQGIGAYAPFLQAGQKTLEGGISTLGAAGQAIADVNVAPQFAEAHRLLGQAAQGVSGATGFYDPRITQSFMDPYQQQVTQNALKEMQRSADIQRQGMAARAVSAGAFGGTREGVERAEFNRGLQDIMSQRIMEDLSRNYQQAQQAGMGSFENQQQRLLSGMGLLGQLGQGIGSLGSQYGQLGLQRGVALGDIGQTLGTMGINQAGLGESAQRLGQGDVNTLLTLGGLQQGTEQERLNAFRATEMQKATSPYQRLAFLSDIYKNAPSTQMSITGATAPTTSPLVQAAGIGIGGVAAATGAKKAGIFG